MPKSVHPSSDASEAAADGLDGLWRLAAKGAYAVPVEDARSNAGDFAVFSPRNDFVAPLVVVSADAFAWARSRGWVEPDPSAGDRYRLASAGRKALRRAKSGPGRVTAAPKLSSAAAPPPAGLPCAHPRAAPERPLAWLRRRKDKAGKPLVTQPQFEAGERLAADFWHAQLSPRVTADWSAPSARRRAPRATPGVGVEISDHVVAARQRVQRALAAVGPELSGLLVDVCCREVGLEAAERAHGLPQRAGKIILQLALTSLARHYGLIFSEPSACARRLRHWGAEDYRPDLKAWR